MSDEGKGAEPLVSRVEIRNMLGVTKQRVLQITAEKTFPEPFQVLGNGRTPVWKRKVIEKWIAGRK